MASERQITSLERLRILANDLRMTILRICSGEEPFSVQMIAKEVGLPHGKVYYHVRRLVEAGFLEEAGQRRVNGIVERLYRSAADSFYADAASIGFSNAQDVLMVRGGLFEQALAICRRYFSAGGSFGLTVEELYLTAEDRRHFGAAMANFVTPYLKPHAGAKKAPFVAMLFDS